MKLRSKASEAILQRDIEDLRKQLTELTNSNNNLFKRNLELELRSKQVEDELADLGFKVDLKPAAEARYVIKKR